MGTKMDIVQRIESLAKSPSYLEQLYALVTSGSPEDSADFRELLKTRLQGDHTIPVKTKMFGYILSPALTSDEFEENQLIAYLYECLKHNDQQSAAERLRHETVYLLRTALIALSDSKVTEKPPINYIRELSCLLAVIEIEKSPQLNQELREQTWSWLEKSSGSLHISVSGERFGWIHRIFDIWLITTSQEDCEESCKKQLRELFENNINEASLDSNNPIQFKFWLLIFRALVKLDREFAGNIALFKLCQILIQANQEALTRSFYSLCWDLGILIRRTEGWLESFVKGLDAIPDDTRSVALQSPIFIQALSRMKISGSPLLPADIRFIFVSRHIKNQLVAQQSHSEKKQKWEQEWKNLENKGDIAAMAMILRDKVIDRLGGDSFRIKVLDLFFLQLESFVEGTLRQYYRTSALYNEPIKRFEEYLEQNFYSTAFQILCSFHYDGSFVIIDKTPENSNMLEENGLIASFQKKLESLQNPTNINGVHLNAKINDESFEIYQSVT